MKINITKTRQQQLIDSLSIAVDVSLDKNSLVQKIYIINTWLESKEFTISPV